MSNVSKLLFPLLVIEFTITPERTFEIILEDKGRPPPEKTFDAKEAYPTAHCRVVVRSRESDIEAFYLSTDEVGDPHWEKLINNGVYSFRGAPADHYLWRRMIIAEAFRRLASSAPRSMKEAPNGARVVKIS